MEQTLNVNLSNTFGSPHYVGWIHRLIGGYHNEFFYTVSNGQVRNDFSAPHVSVHSLKWIVFHHGHMFVGGSMIDEMRFKCFEKQGHAALISHITDKWMKT